MYKVEVAGNNSGNYKVSSEGHSFNISIKEQGITPSAALLASLGSCVGVYLEKYIEGAKLPVRDFKITVQSEFSKEKPLCFRDIKVTVDMMGGTMDEKRKKVLINFLKNCPVHSTLKACPNIDTEVV